MNEILTKVSLPVGSTATEADLDATRTHGTETPGQIFAPSAPELRKLPTLPGYRVLDELGKGGMGIVYKAWHENLGREVALKIVSTGPQRSSEDRLRFRREATTAARLAHPNIVPVFDVGETDQYAYLSMSFVTGGTLRDWQDSRPIPPRTAAKIGVALASAIAHAHDHGILHRDLKPANILLAPATGDCHDGVCVRPEAMPSGPWAIFDQDIGDSSTTLRLGFTPKIADFGLAKEMNSPDLTATGFAVGTPQYMAPEQLETGGSSVRSDVYQLGVVLFEMLAGRSPFVAATAAEIMRMVMTKDAPSPRPFAPGIPRDLEVIVGKCLERDPKRRYESAQALGDDLIRFLGRKPIKARPMCPPSRVYRWARRHPSLAALMLTFAFSAVGGIAAAVAVWRAGRDERAALNAMELANRELVAANEARDAEIARAEENFKLAREAVRSTLLELGNHAELKHPRHIELRRRLLDRAKPAFDRFIAQDSNDVVTIRERAQICRQLGVMRTSVGDVPRAVKRFDQALASYRRLDELLPDDPVIDRELCDVLMHSAWLLRKAGRELEGDACNAEAITRLDARHAADPADTPTTIELARAEIAFRHHGSSDPRPAEAETRARRALGLIAEVRRLEPGNLRAVHIQGRVYRRLAETLIAGRKPDEAATCFETAARIREGIVALQPDAPEHLIELVETYCGHSACVPPADAVRYLRRAIEVADGIRRVAPTVPMCALPAVTAHALLGERLGGEDGLREMNVAVGAIDQVYAVTENRLTCRTHLRDALVRRAELFKALGRPEDERADRERAAKVMEEPSAPKQTD